MQCIISINTSDTAHHRVLEGIINAAAALQKNAGHGSGWDTIRKRWSKRVVAAQCMVMARTAEQQNKVTGHTHGHRSDLSVDLSSHQIKWVACSCSILVFHSCIVVTECSWTCFWIRPRQMIWWKLTHFILHFLPRWAVPEGCWGLQHHSFPVYDWWELHLHTAVMKLLQRVDRCSCGQEAAWSSSVIWVHLWKENIHFVLSWWKLEVFAVDCRDHLMLQPWMGHSFKNFALESIQKEKSHIWVSQLQCTLL